MTHLNQQPWLRPSSDIVLRNSLPFLPPLEGCLGDTGLREPSFLFQGNETRVRGASLTAAINSGAYPDARNT